MPPRLVILDFDGTLADSWPWLLGTLDEVTETLGLARIGAAEAEALRGQDTAAILRALGVKLWQMPRIAAHMKRLVAAAPPPPLFPAIPDLLHRLAARGIVLSIASSNTEAQIRRTLGPELCALVRHLAVEARLFGKAARFRHILREAGIAPTAAIAIGDEVRDMEAARAAGVAAGAVAWGYARPELLATRRPDALFDTPEAIARYCAA